MGLSCLFFEVVICEPKIKKLTDYCYAMQSSNESLVSDLILERVKQKTMVSQEPTKIENIVTNLRNECITYKRDWIENEVLCKYNLVFEKLGTKPESIVNDAVKEVVTRQYYEFNFIVLGIEPLGDAHIFKVDHYAKRIRSLLKQIEIKSSSD